MYNELDRYYVIIVISDRPILLIDLDFTFPPFLLLLSLFPTRLVLFIHFVIYSSMGLQPPHFLYLDQITVSHSDFLLRSFESHSKNM